MNQIPCCDWQDRAILPTQDFSLGPTGSEIIFWCFIPYNKSLIDQACSVKMAGYLPHSFLHVYGPQLRLGS